MKEIIKVSNLKFHYDGQYILRGIDLSINAGDFVALVGSNGAGKSTLLKLILGELSPKAGLVRIMGTDPREFDKWYRVGYVPQMGSQPLSGFPASVEEVVMANLFSRIGLLRFPKREHKERTKEALRLVGMLEHSRELVGNLSGGQQQRVLLARALVNDPDILLLDEPTTGVDEETADSFYKLIKKLNEDSKITILMVTHDIDRASIYISRAFCLEKGTVVELTKDEIKKELDHKHKHPEIDEGDENSGDF